MIFTSTTYQIQKLKDRVARLHPNIKVNFLDVQTETIDSALFTSVHHKPYCESYRAPFLSDHPR